MYRLKHKLTGLYFQPHKHRGSHLSKTGKIYHSKHNGLTSAFRSANYNKTSYDKYTFTIRCEYGSTIHKLTQDILNWSTPNKSYYGVLCGQISCNTVLTDWEEEKIN